jgi:hypothetical protein
MHVLVKIPECLQERRRRRLRSGGGEMLFTNRESEEKFIREYENL